MNTSTSKEVPGTSVPETSCNGDSPRTPSSQHVPIAIVGMSCRFGGQVTSPSKLWDLCANGQDGWSPVPENRFNVKAAKNLPKGGFFLKEDPALFDAAFFNYSADVASGMDPQIRLLLESVFEATENAGIPLEKLAGSNTSMFTGVYAKDFYDLLMHDPERIPGSFITGNGTAMLSNRISHFYDFRGASVTVDTGCSSGLTALHQGCETLSSGASDVSIVSGASVLLSRDQIVGMVKQGVLGKDGRCYAWDERANGYGRGEGIATLVLKPLESALRDGDNVYSVIRGIGLNQDGKTTTITSPSMEAQQTLIEECYRRFGLELSQTPYVEAHMTGTPVGDPIEAEAISRTFGKSREGSNPVIVGSVKTNIGHTEPVSGLAAVIKTTYALKNRKIPPNLNYKNNNPAIPVEEWNLKVPTTLMDWPADQPLRASVNNFGYGGTNAHVILEAPPAQVEVVKAQESSEEPRKVFVFSAKDSTASKDMAESYAKYIRSVLETGEKPSIDDLAYTLSERRSAFPWTGAVRARSLEELADCLESPAFKTVLSPKRPRIGFVFNGQGAQWYAMGRELIGAYPIFNASLREADRILREVYGASWSLYDELTREESETRVHETNISQPINVALQLCLVDLLNDWGITPSAVTSHSSGEIAAAYAVKVLTFEQALGVVYYRGELALKYQKQSALSGGMLAAGVGAEDAEKYLANTEGGRVVVACINSQDSVTLSGDMAAIEEVEARLKADSIFARKLKVPLAYHSHHMQHMAQDYLEKLKTVIPNADEAKWTGARFASPVTGEILESPADLVAEHWVQNLTSPVLFSQAFEKMCFGSESSGERTSSVDLILEIGAHSTLSGPIRSILGEQKLPYVSCLKRSTDAVQTAQEVACELLRRGYPVSVSSVNLQSKEHKYKLLENLPSYAWNHTKRYWSESRVSRENRFQSCPPHELVGSRVAGDNASTFSWRNFLKASSIPWLAEHKVESKVVLPGAAYVAMAIEAVRMLSGEGEKSIRGFSLRDIDITNALTIPESATVEVRLSLRPCSDKELDSKGWYDFDVSSIGEGDNWIQHCKGYVVGETSSATKAPTAQELTAPQADSFYSAGAKAREFDIETFYSGLRDMGFYHGPVFQNLIHSTASENKGISELVVSSAASDDTDYVLHPGTLDAIIQSAYVDMADQTSNGSMVLPRAIKSMFVPASLNRRGGEKLHAFTQLVKSDKKGSKTNIRVVNEHAGKDTTSFLQINDFFAQAIPKASGEDSDDSGICFKSRWELDVLHNMPLSVKESIVMTPDLEEAEFEDKMVRASYYFIKDCLEELEEEDENEWIWHQKIFHGWMQAIVAQAAKGELGPGSQTWSKTSMGLQQMLFDELSSANAAGELLCRVGPELAEIVRGSITPLELMMQDNLLNRYYMEIPRFRSRIYPQLEKVIQLYAAKNPGAKVLEIGAGTGGATGAVLNGFAALGEGTGTLLGTYDFTDVSSGFFEAGRQKFASWDKLMEFKKLDIEVDPANQGFATGTYDLIVASMVLHATKSLNRTIANVKRLLKPGGKLIIIECVQDQLDSQLIFGTLPGWWLAEEADRKMSPNAPLKIWDRVFREEGFSGADFEIPDHIEPERLSVSLIATTVIPEPKLPSSLSIIYSNPPPQQWLDKLIADVELKTGARPTVEKFDEAQAEGKVCIFTAEMEAAFVDKLDENAFNKLRNLIVSSEGVLWLSRSGLVDAKEPLFAQVQGLLRTMKHEDSSKRCVHLDFDTNTETWDEEQIGQVVHVLGESFDYSKNLGDFESEYAVEDGILHFSRIYPDKARDNAVKKVAADPPAEMQPFNQPGRVLIWESGQTGLLSDMYFTDDHSHTVDITSGLIEVETKASGLNFRDVMCALGQIDGDVVHEICGVVTAIGPDCEESGLEVGDRVCGMYRGRVTNIARSHWRDFAKIPDEVSFEEGASMPTVYVTAYHSLVNLARLEKGETVLIHAGTGGVGQAAIMLAQHIGAEIYATCSTEAKRDFLVERYGIQADHIMSSRDTTFAPAIMEKTGGKGVDVILNSLSGPLLKASWGCIARFGRFLEIGKVDTEAGRFLEMTGFSRAASLHGIDIAFLMEYKKHVFGRALDACIKLHSESILRTIYPVTTYSISEMESALRMLQSGKHLGKLVLVPRPGDLVKVVPRPKPFTLDDPNSTYLIVGGLGGIGRRMAQWMVENGAKNIVLTSRRAESHPEALDLVKSARADGCNLYIRNCDVSNEQDLLRMLSDIATVAPPIRGVVTLAMALDDTVIERMTFEQWRRGILPKVAGTMNLHNNLPDVSFFIMLSSLAGIFGNTSQANYNAGNAFQDALARHRTSLGLPALVIDLGEVKDVGFVAEQDESNRSRIKKSLSLGGVAQAMEIDQLLRLIEDGIRRPLRSNPDDSQVVTCLVSWDTVPEGATARQDRRFTTLRLATPLTSSSAPVAAAAEDTTAILTQNLSTPNTTIADATKLIAEALTKKMSDIFSIAVAEIEASLPMSHYGVDSLVAVELRNWLSNAAKAKVSVFEILQSSSLTDFAKFAATKSEFLINVE